ncbi:class I SAM-dependent methyltransferase [Heyndrickxia vini]|uniref:Class I SAM-dependent methyltransferase n=1 Tax=Heyndrickxia vini TaxID=1476025 RepID=A0ABX7DY07_9BACI|nr:class I SAM-dependent methyltransferase [Heyndrickxia vini]QQZ07805.1 class I SAM-dependent methyltransferase [Heyndrickxia vini]
MDIKKNVQKQFGRSANSYVTSEIHQKGKDLQKLIEIANLTGNEDVLDIATGGGHTANAFAHYVKHVTAVDLTAEMIKAAKGFIEDNGRTNVSFIQGDAEKLPFDHECFDIVTCRIAPHHFPNINKFIESVHKVLKPGGMFLLDDNVSPENDDQDQFYNKIEEKRDYSHYRAWKKTEWIRMLEEKGFNIEEMYRFEKTFQFDSWCNRMNLNAEEKNELTEFMLHASSDIKKKFQIEVIENSIISFKGEAIILKAHKI